MDGVWLASSVGPAAAVGVSLIACLKRPVPAAGESSSVGEQVRAL